MRRLASVLKGVGAVAVLVAAGAPAVPVAAAGSGVYGSTRGAQAPLVALPAARPFAATATLTGAQEVPPVATRARGVAVFGPLSGPSADATALPYTLTLVNLTDPTAAHIHLGVPGVNGPVVAFLCGGGGKPACPANGKVEGTLTAADLRGPLAGQPLGALLAAMATGGTYTNAHTAANPGGEVRGRNVVR